jgi:hypothetical protein
MTEEGGQEGWRKMATWSLRVPSVSQRKGWEAPGTWVFLRHLSMAAGMNENKSGTRQWVEEEFLTGETQSVSRGTDLDTPVSRAKLLSVLN